MVERSRRTRTTIQNQEQPEQKSVPLDQSELKRQLHYDPDTGIFTRLISNANQIKVGDIAGSRGDGYIRIRLNSELYCANCLAWLYMEGYWPEYEIDHKNGVKDDNRWVNLRHATHACNMQNKKISKHNTSGFPGVTQDKRTLEWRAQIKINYKQIIIGSYNTPLEAALARFTFEVWCPTWTCNYRSELVKAIKNAWPEFKAY